MKQWEIKRPFKDIISKIKEKTGSPILIIGDIILDHYQYGTVDRISPEAPVPIVLIKKEEYKLGGAANVANNISALGETPHLIGIIGRDNEADNLKKILQDKKISYKLITTSKCPTIKKTRIIAQNQQVLRLDRESIDVSHWDSLKKVIKEFKDKFEIVIISDYGKGVVGKELLDFVCKWKSRILIDPKKRNFKNYKGGYLLTPNKKETEELSGIQINDKSSIIKAGEIILEKTQTKNLLITLGSQGMVLFKSQGQEIIHLPTMGRKVFDVTGAGDTVLSAIALGLAKGLDLVASCIFANICAGIVVGKVGTSVALWTDIEPLNGKWEEYLKLSKWR